MKNNSGFISEKVLLKKITATKWRFKLILLAYYNGISMYKENYLTTINMNANMKRKMSKIQNGKKNLLSGAALAMFLSLCRSLARSFLSSSLSMRPSSLSTGNSKLTTYMFNARESIA